MKNNKTVLIIRNTLIIFAVTMLYCFVKNFDMSETELYSLFLADFSIGFCSRFLIGSILGLFKESFTREWMTAFLQIFTMTVFLAVSHYFGSTIVRQEKKTEKILILFTGLFIACPFSITVYAGDIFGFIDVFCMAVLIITAYLAEHRLLIWFVPVLMIAGAFIHDSFLTGYLAPCLGILVWYTSEKTGGKLRDYTVFAVSSAAGILSGIYTVFFSRKTIKMSADEVLTYLAEKGSTTISDVSGYIEDIVLWVDVHNVAPSDAERTSLNNIIYMAKVAIEELDKKDLIAFISIIPIIALIFYIWIKAIKNGTTFFEKIPYILFMLTPVPQLLSLFLSNDFTRFLSTIVITQMLYLFMTLRTGKKHITSTVQTLSDNLQLFIIPCVSVLLTNII